MAISTSSIGPPPSPSTDVEEPGKTVTSSSPLFVATVAVVCVTFFKFNGRFSLSARVYSWALASLIREREIIGAGVEVEVEVELMFVFNMEVGFEEDA
jgi:hypothetical protein